MKYTKYIVVVVVALLIVLIVYFRGKSSPQVEDYSVGQNKADQAMEDNLKVEDIEIGTGTEAVNGKILTVHYTGTLSDGIKFDSSIDRGQPFSFSLGASQVIAGWDQGLLGMKVGGKRKLTIPPQLAYGDQGVPGAIPPNAALIFEVELLDVK